jgi:hypothetical protein
MPVAFEDTDEGVTWTSLAGFIGRPQADQANRRHEDEKEF